MSVDVPGEFDTTNEASAAIPDMAAVPVVHWLIFFGGIRGAKQFGMYSGQAILVASTSKNARAAQSSRPTTPHSNGNGGKIYWVHHIFVVLP